MIPRMRFMLVMSLMILFMGSISFAQDYKEDAKRHYMQGVALFDEGNFEAALAEFKASYKANPNFRVLMNISACLKSLYRYAEAARTLEQYLEGGKGKISKAREQEILEAIEELKSLLAPVTIQVDEEDATINVDGVMMGTSPMQKPVLMDPGEHEITIIKEGFKEVKRKITVAASQAQTVNLTIAEFKNEGRVIVKASVRDADVRIDGEVVGKVPWEGDLTTGGHVLEVTAENMKPFRSELVIAANQTRELNVELKPLLEKVKVRIEASEAGSTVYIDGETMGFAPWEGELSVGGHQLEVLHDDKAPYRTELTLVAGQDRTIMARLEEKVVASEKDNTALALGLGITGGVLAVGGAVILGLWLGGILWPDPEEPVDGSLQPGAYQL